MDQRLLDKGFLEQKINGQKYLLLNPKILTPFQ